MYHAMLLLMLCVALQPYLVHLPNGQASTQHHTSEKISIFWCAFMDKSDRAFAITVTIELPTCQACIGILLILAS